MTLPSTLSARLNHTRAFIGWKTALSSLALFLSSFWASAATVSASGTTITITLNASESLAVVSNGSSYVFTLATGATWSGLPVTGASASGETLTINSTGLGTYDLFKVEDAGAGVTLSFDDSQSNTFNDNFQVTFDAGAGSTQFSFGTTSFSGSNGLELTTDGPVLFNQGTLRSSNGNLTISANMQATPRSFEYNGIAVESNSLIESTGTGIVSVKGKGGSGTGPNYGIKFSGGSVIRGGTTGTTVIEGYGGVCSSNTVYGINFSSSDDLVTSNGAHVSVTTVGGGTGTSYSNHGLYMSAGTIKAGGSGNLTVVGTGGATSGGTCHGVMVDGVGGGTSITSSGGNVSVSGTGGGSGSSSSNYGIHLFNGGKITAVGTGTVAVTGTGGSGTGNNNWGVYVTSTNSIITSGGGNVTVTGTGGGSSSSASNYGVYVYSGGLITADGSGAVSVTGSGGSSTGNDNYGVLISSTVTSAGGNVSVTGTGGGSSVSIRNYGVSVTGSINAGSGGTLTVVGTGGNTTGAGADVDGTTSTLSKNNIGVMLQNGTIETPDGNVSITANGGGSANAVVSNSGNNHGIWMEGTSKIRANGAGASTTITAKGGGNSTAHNWGSNHGIYIYSSSNPTITAASGALTINSTGGGDGGTSADNYGIYIRNTGSIFVTDGQTATVNATGGASINGRNYGIYIQGTNASTHARFYSDGTGSMTVNATAGTATNYGIFMDRASRFLVNGAGTMTVNSTSIYMTQEINGTNIRPEFITASSSGTIVINATQGGNGIHMAMQPGYFNLSAGGNMTLTANALLMSTATVNASINSAVALASGSTLTLKPQSNPTPIGVDLGSSSNPVAGPLGITSTELGLFNGGNLVIGDANTGEINVSASVTANTNTNIKLVTAASSAGVSPKATGTDITMGSGKTLTLAAPLNIQINGTTANNESTGYRQLMVGGDGSTLALNGATLNLTGSYTPAVGNSFIIISAPSITGTFDGLPEGATLTYKGQTLLVRYSSTAVTLYYSRTLTWMGGTSSAWGTSSNWSPAIVPTSNDIVSISSSATNMPAVSANSTMYSLSIPASSNMSVASGQTLTLTGSLTLGGNLTGAGTLSMAGSTAQSISGTGSVSNLSINNTTGVSIAAGAGNLLTVTGTLTPTAGTLTTNGNLRLKSDATYTARIAEHGNTGTISGNVAVERFMAASGRTHQWRILGFPYSTPVTLSAISGLGIDVNTNRSIMLFNEGADDQNYTTGGARNTGYQTLTSMSDNIPAYRGFAAWVFGGSGTTAGAGTLSSDLTVTSTGTLNESGNPVVMNLGFTSLSQGWNLVANPYASSINWATVTATAANLTNVGASIYRWDPVAQAWVTHNGSAGTGMDNIIESGAGFFIRTTGAAPTLTIPQSAKVATNANATNLFRAAPFRLDLKGESARSLQGAPLGIRLRASGMGNPAADEVYLDLSRQDASPGFDSRYDAHSMGRTSGTGLAFTDVSGNAYAMQYDRPIPATIREKRSYPLTVTTPQKGDTRITLSLVGDWDPANNVCLIDRLENRTIPLTGNTLEYAFRMEKLKDTARFQVAINLLPAQIGPSGIRILTLGNPVHTDEVQLLITHPSAEPRRWTLLSVTGANVGAGSFQQGQGNVQYRLKIPGMHSAGTYQLRVEMDNGELHTQRIIRQ